MIKRPELEDDGLVIPFRDMRLFFVKLNDLPAVVKMQLGFLGFLVAIMVFWPQWSFANTVNTYTNKTVGTVYQNTGTTTRMVFASVIPTSGARDFQCLTGATSPPTLAWSQVQTSNQATSTCTMLVEPNWYYFVRFVPGTVVSTLPLWVESDFPSNISTSSTNVAVTFPTTSALQINNTSFDVFAGMVLLLVGFLGTTWFFRRR